MGDIPTIDEILTQIHRHFGVPPSIIKNKLYRSPQVSYARRITSYLAKKLTLMSSRQVGRELNLDAASISIHNTKTRYEAQKDPAFQAKLVSIINDIEQSTP